MILRSNSPSLWTTVAYGSFKVKPFFKRALYNYYLMWINNYKPTSLKEFQGNNDIKGILEKIIAFGRNTNFCPNMIFQSSTGYGKTSLIQCFLNEWFDEKVDITFNLDNADNILELNTSNDRGINVIKTDIVSFAKKKTSKKKFIILEELDNLQENLQYSFLTLVQQFDNITFLCTCNHLNKIIEDFQSTCILFNLKPCSKDEKENILKNILEKNFFEKNFLEKNSQKILETNDIRLIINRFELIYKYGVPSSKILNIELLEKLKELFNIHEKHELYKRLCKIKEDGFDENDILFCLIENTQLDEDNYERIGNVLMNSTERKISLLQLVKLFN